MKVVLKSAEDERDSRNAFVVEIDGLEVMSFYEGEPEDNNLYRNFSDIFGIDKLLVAAHEAGKRGEDLVIESLAVDWGDL